MGPHAMVSQADPCQVQWQHWDPEVSRLAGKKRHHKHYHFQLPSISICQASCIFTRTDSDIAVPDSSQCSLKLVDPINFWKHGSTPQTHSIRVTSQTFAEHVVSRSFETVHGEMMRWLSCGCRRRATSGSTLRGAEFRVGQWDPPRNILTMLLMIF